MSKKNTLMQSIQQKLGGKRISGSLVTLSSAAILAVYAAGYEQTKAAADRIAAQSNEFLAGGPGSAVAPLSGEPATSTSPASVVPATPGPASTDRAPLQVASNVVAAAANAPAAPPSSESIAASPVKPAETASVNEAVAVLNEPRDLRAVEPLPAAAPAPVPAPVAAPVAAPPQPAPPVVRQSLYKDGTYDGWGTSRHGNIQVAVVIQDGRIASAAIAQCLTRYPCSWIAQLPGQVVSRQSPNVDYVSGATQSVNAYYGAVVEALAKAK